MEFPKFLKRNKEEEPKEEDFAKTAEKIEEEAKNLRDRFVPPHNKRSRHVTPKDIKRVKKDGEDMLMLCHIGRGPYPTGDALAHPQIDDKDPLRFFVTRAGLVVINPLIINHTKAHLWDVEGCLSFPDEKPKTMVPRYYKIVVEYQTLIEDPKKKGEVSLGAFQIGEFKGMAARIIQHELCHLNGSYIYDKDFDPSKAVGLGDGIVINHSVWDNK